MAGEILVSGEARRGSISAAIVTDEQRSLKPKDPCPFRELILGAADLPPQPFYSPPQQKRGRRVLAVLFQSQRRSLERFKKY